MGKMLCTDEFFATFRLLKDVALITFISTSFRGLNFIVAFCVCLLKLLSLDDVKNHPPR